MTKWAGSTAVEIADAVRSGTADPREVAAEHLDRIETINSDVNAFRVILREEALAEAAALADRPDLGELPLAGVPVAIKDNVEVAGVQMYDGAAAPVGPPAAQDHDVVRRLRAAGAIVVGITNVPELCVWAATDGTAGVTRNPWDLTRTPGGSSGGSAAAVAARLVPLAHGNDGMGSIRIPAACCGLVGIKPGHGVVPGLANEWFGLAENGPLATTVADLAVGLAVMADRPDLGQATRPTGTLRVAVSTRTPIAGFGPDADQAEVARSVGAVLIEAGHQVTAADPAYPAWLMQAAGARWTAGTATDAAAYPPGTLQRRTRLHAGMSKVYERMGLRRDRYVQRWQEMAGEFLTSHDVLVTPALARRPIRAIEWSRRGWLSNLVSNARFAPFAAPWNFAAFPAMTVPAGRRSDGFPLAVQLVARPGREDLLLSVAAQLEELNPWPRHAPAYA